jgi:hypothetical protein
MLGYRFLRITLKFKRLQIRQLISISNSIPFLLFSLFDVQDVIVPR